MSVFYIILDPIMQNKVIITSQIYLNPDFCVFIKNENKSKTCRNVSI